GPEARVLFPRQRSRSGAALCLRRLRGPRPRPFEPRLGLRRCADKPARGAKVILPLDSRQVRIARLLLEQSDTTRLEQVASSLRLTDRVVRYNLPTVEAYLSGHGLTL